MKNAPLRIQSAIGEWFCRNGGHASVRDAVLRTGKEYAELHAAIQMEDVREEAADTAMCLFMVAEIAGFDLLAAVVEKLAINEQRQWTVDAAGCLHHVKGSDPREPKSDMGGPAESREDQ